MARRTSDSAKALFGNEHSRTMSGEGCGDISEPFSIVSAAPFNGPQLRLSFRIAILNPEVGSMRALWLLCAVGAAWAQGLTVQTPEVSVYEGTKPWSRLAGRYLPAPCRARFLRIPAG